MFPFLQPLIRPRKAAGTAALQDAPAPPTRCLAKPGVGTAVPSRPRLSRRAGDSTPHLPVDSFSLREKVAAGRMRVKTLGCFFVNAMFSPSPLPSPRRGRCSVRGSVGECGSLHPFFGSFQFVVSSFQFFKIRFSVLGFLYPQMSENHADSVYRILICVNLRHLRIPSPKPCLSCSSMFPFLQYPIRHRKAAGTAALQDAPATKQTPLAGRGRRGIPGGPHFLFYFLNVSVFNRS